MDVATKTAKSQDPKAAGDEKFGGSFADQFRLTGRLAFLDLKDEALLTVCMISAIAAVLAPMLILIGLKFGVVDILRKELIEDPDYRLLQPIASKSRPESFFDDLAKRPGISFVQPRVNLSDTSVRLRTPDRKSGESFNLKPTHAGDPLLLESGGLIPQEGEVTLSAVGAAKLKVKTGDKVILYITRSNRKRREREEVELVVKSVLKASADPHSSAYTPLILVQDVERFKSGIPVASRGWTGIIGAPKQTFDSVYLALDNRLNPVELNTLKITSGFAIGEERTPEQFTAETGFRAPADRQLVRIANRRTHVDGSAIQRMLGRIGGRSPIVLPHVEGLLASVEGVDSDSVPVAAAHPDLAGATLAAGDLTAWKPWRDDLSYGQVDRIVLPKALAEKGGIAVGARITLSIKPRSEADQTRDLAAVVYVEALSNGDRILVHPALAGMMARGRIRKIAYDGQINSLIQSDPGLRGFRAYATTIDEVPRLARELTEEGLELRTRDKQIEVVQRTDRALTQMILLIGAVALIGGVAVLIASFYAAVERKKGELALLRLVGLSRWSLFTMPVQQSLMFGVSGFLVAYSLFLIFAGIINNFYAADLRLPGSLCRLPMGYVISSLIVTIGLAALSSTIGAARATRIDPAEALRIE